jgi:hypothetical protein
MSDPYVQGEPAQSPDSVVVDEIQVALDILMVRIIEIGKEAQIPEDGMTNLLNVYFGNSLSYYLNQYDWIER